MHNDPVNRSAALPYYFSLFITPNECQIKPFTCTNNQIFDKLNIPIPPQIAAIPTPNVNQNNYNIDKKKLVTNIINKYTDNLFTSISSNNMKKSVHYIINSLIKLLSSQIIGYLNKLNLYHNNSAMNEYYKYHFDIYSDVWSMHVRQMPRIIYNWNKAFYILKSVDIADNSYNQLIPITDHVLKTVLNKLDFNAKEYAYYIQKNYSVLFNSQSYSKDIRAGAAELASILNEFVNEDIIKLLAYANSNNKLKRKKDLDSVQKMVDIAIIKFSRAIKLLYNYQMNISRQKKAFSDQLFPSLDHKNIALEILNTALLQC